MQVKKIIRDVSLAVSRLLLAATFIVSGFSKLDDPLGTAYKLTEYANSLGFSSLLPHPIIVQLIAVLFGTFEFTLGILMLFAANRKSVSVLMLIFMCFMTPFTLYIALTNPVAECGCFGSLIHLTNTQTFVKNIILLICAIVVCRWHTLMNQIVSPHGQWMIRLYTITYALILSIVCILTLPTIDTMAYKVGTHIGTDDATLNFMAIDQQTGVEQTDSLLSSKYTLLLTSYDLAIADDGEVDRINLLYTYASRNKIRMAMLTSTDDEAEITRWREITGAEYPIYWSDEYELRAMVRSNPGLVLLKDGVVYRKWSHYSIPEMDIYNFCLTTEQQPWLQDSQASLTFTILRLLLWFVIPLFIWSILDYIYKRYKKSKSKNLNSI